MLGIDVAGGPLRVWQARQRWSMHLAKASIRVCSSACPSSPQPTVNRPPPPSGRRLWDATMAAGLPFRDINVHSSPSHYAFSSPSSPSAPTLVVDRPSGDLRLHDGKLLGSKRVSSIAGILGMIKLRLG